MQHTAATVEPRLRCARRVSIVGTTAVNERRKGRSDGRIDGPQLFTHKTQSLSAVKREVVDEEQNEFEAAAACVMRAQRLHF